MFIDALRVGVNVMSGVRVVVEQVMPKLLPEMRQFVDRLYTLAEKYPSLWKNEAEVVEKGTEILGDVLYAVGLTAEPIESLGAKACQAEKRAEEFETVEEYIQYLHNDVELDPETISGCTIEEGIAHKMIGMALAASAIGEKLDIKLTADFAILLTKIAEAADGSVNAEDMVAFFRQCKEKMGTDMNEVYEYFSGLGRNMVSTGEKIREVFTEVFPGKAADMIQEIKERVYNDNIR